MKLTVQAPAVEVELTEAEAETLREVCRGETVYWTQGNGDLLDSLSGKGLVYAGCGGGSDERYRLTALGKEAYAAINCYSPDL